MPLFRKKPLAVEAIFWSGDNYDDVVVFASGNAGNIVDLRGEHTIVIRMRDSPAVMVARSEWIIKEPFPTPDRKFYTCEPSTFDKTHDQVPEKCPCCRTRSPQPTHPGFLCITCITNP